MEEAARTREQVGHPWLLRSVNTTQVSGCNCPHAMRRGSTPHFLLEQSQTQEPRPPRLHGVRQSGGRRLCFPGHHRYPSGRYCCVSVVRSLQRLNTPQIPGVPTFRLLITEQRELGPLSASAAWAPVPRAAEQVWASRDPSPKGLLSPPSCSALTRETTGPGLVTPPLSIVYSWLRRPGALGCPLAF